MPKKVFISYSWDSKEHQEWVVALTNELRSTYGVDAKCDVLLDNPNLFSMMVQEANVNDKIIIVDTKRYTEKADHEQGGVGYETRLFYNFFQKRPQKLIVIKRGNCELPFYLNGWNYLDFTCGMTEENLDALVLKINDEAPYIMAPITKSPRAVKGKIAESALDGSIIPDLRVVTQQGKDEYLEEEFETAYKTISDLLQQTKQKNPSLKFEIEKREVNVPSGTGILEGGSFKQQVNHYIVYTYSVNYQDKEAYYRIWLSMTDNRAVGKGIFGSNDRPMFGRRQEFNSFQLWVYVSNSSSKLQLACNPIWGNDTITNGKELGVFIFKKLIDVIKQ